LFDRLKAWRSELASARGVPAYVIATDRSLKHLAANRPTSRQELQAIHGFGAVKVEALADEILPLIQSESESNP
jgi:superfamily II DNA helicase RecQ